MDLHGSLLDSLPDAVLVIEDGLVTWANGRAGELVGTSAESLVGCPLTDLMEPTEIDRIFSLEQNRREGWDVPRVLRVRLHHGREGAPLFADVAIARQEGRLLLAVREATESRAAEELMSQLGNLSVDAGAILDLEGLLDASSPIFAALGWVVALIEVRGEVARLTRRAGVLSDNPVAEYTRALLGLDRPLADYPVVAAVVKRGQPLFLDDLPTLQAGPVASAVVLSERMRQSRGLTRSAWLPVPDALGEVMVLAVAGSRLTHYDFVATQLFAAQLASARRLTRLRAELVHRERLAAADELAAMERIARNSLAVRDRLNTPLQTLEVGLELVRRQATDEQIRARITKLAAALEGLKSLSRQLASAEQGPGAQLGAPSRS